MLKVLTPLGKQVFLGKKAEILSMPTSYTHDSFTKDLKEGLAAYDESSAVYPEEALPPYDEVQDNINFLDVLSDYQKKGVSEFSISSANSYLHTEISQSQAAVKQDESDFQKYCTALGISIGHLESAHLESEALNLEEIQGLRKDLYSETKAYIKAQGKQERQLKLLLGLIGKELQSAMIGLHDVPFNQKGMNSLDLVSNRNYLEQVQDEYSTICKYFMQCKKVCTPIVKTVSREYLAQANFKQFEELLYTHQGQVIDHSLVNSRIMQDLESLDKQYGLLAINGNLISSHRYAEANNFKALFANKFQGHQNQFLIQEVNKLLNLTKSLNKIEGRITTLWQNWDNYTALTYEKEESEQNSFNGSEVAESEWESCTSSEAKLVFSDDKDEQTEVTVKLSAAGNILPLSVIKEESEQNSFNGSEVAESEWESCTSSAAARIFSDDEDQKTEIVGKKNGDNDHAYEVNSGLENPATPLHGKRPSNAQNDDFLALLGTDLSARPESKHGRKKANSVASSTITVAPNIEERNITSVPRPPIPDGKYAYPGSVVGTIQNANAEVASNPSRIKANDVESNISVVPNIQERNITPVGRPPIPSGKYAYPEDQGAGSKVALSSSRQRADSIDPLNDLKREDSYHNSMEVVVINSNPQAKKSHRSEQQDQQGLEYQKIVCEQLLENNAFLADCCNKVIKRLGRKKFGLSNTKQSQQSIERLRIYLIKIEDSTQQLNNNLTILQTNKAPDTSIGTDKAINKRQKHQAKALAIICRNAQGYELGFSRIKRSLIGRFILDENTIEKSLVVEGAGNASLSKKSAVHRKNHTRVIVRARRYTDGIKELFKKTPSMFKKDTEIVDNKSYKECSTHNNKVRFSESTKLDLSVSKELQQIKETVSEQNQGGKMTFAQLLKIVYRALLQSGKESIKAAIQADPKALARKIEKMLQGGNDHHAFFKKDPSLDGKSHHYNSSAVRVPQAHNRLSLTLK